MSEADVACTGYFSQQIEKNSRNGRDHALFLSRSWNQQ
jgi:hypothetical protein